ncbi:MAG: hypothetical protein DCC49_04290 [Acidobacteria bacterium]|nr:MAG: hypothetical protein DCC49_04290 [Acidobacteriota bacterium]
MKKMRGSITGRDEGFTLIELMIVVLIIAILIAIAIPTFLGARERAQDRAAQTSVRNALTAENVYYTDSQAYTQDQPTLAGIEQALTWVPGGPSTGQNEVGVVSGPTGTQAVDGTVVLTVLSAHQHEFSICDSKVDGGNGTGTSYDHEGGGGATGDGSHALEFPCTGAGASTDSSAGWRH